MKRIFLFVAALALSLSALAIYPIRQFEPARYAGYGEWISQDGATGVYKDVSLFNANGYTSIKFSLENLHIFDIQLQINDYGFSNVTVVDVSNPDDIKKYEGYGNCGSYFCSITVKIESGYLHNNIIFNPNGGLSHFGNIASEDGNAIVQWEGYSNRLPQ